MFTMLNIHDTSNTVQVWAIIYLSRNILTVTFKIIHNTLSL